ncbi:hypothetical protein P153DRAFT_215494 [Dothidotthia symphoricarpi CBS 119687]|uniref:Uncharacterized protein n=1 Tax=Dothidotthia symphoricarpi CBS 119687 TaxID=1392245 RepID=A0A6A6AHE1_9PLEO|nr:uncharacterized protein P153DRAFT_215494 [Dothidotthia symphoricarpi CBS 119687]KAF2130307.1 hypothetical protein P153DRAFT_215494 [Dothidotthia symphoricarpi CBS 119687]
MATPSLSTLHHVTKRKLNKLAEHRQKFEADKKAIQASVAAASDHRSKVQVLLEGFDLYGITIEQPELSTYNLARFIHQAKHDPSVPAHLLRDWQTKLEHELDVTSLKYEYAALFGNLVIEWIEYPNPASSTSNNSNSNSDSDIDDSFDAVGRKEMHEQRKEWERHAFTEKKVDQHKIDAYLNDIFGTPLQAKKLKKSPLQELRETMKEVMDFKSNLDTPKREEPLRKGIRRTINEHRFTVDKLTSCIRGVLQSDLLAGQKREALAELENQPAVLKELVDVLNFDLEGLDQWEWDPTPVPLHMRRQLNGKYRVYMDEEVHQAILLHFVGKTWAVALKKAFNAFYHSGAWLQTSYRSMNKKARQRREYFVEGSTGKSDNVRNHRREKYSQEYFMTQLPDNDSDDYRDYAAEDHEDHEESQLGQSKSPLATKQSMLRLVTTEMLLNTKVYGEFLVWQSDFKWFGPSLPHDTIFAVLKFFGVPEKWLRFFKTFLQAPVVFAQDGPGAQIHVRNCGIPMSHLLSDALGEAVLFCLDFAVNKRTQGVNIHRFHDDLWFWGQESTCIQAWHALQEFTGVMGLELNGEKTGAALVVADKTKARTFPQSLPQGTIKWGFLNLDASTGCWVIDRGEVDKHIEELRRQLGACRSVMAWVQAWNSYVSRFFSNNFGQPANCLGRQHNDMIINTFEHIQRSLFAGEGTASVTDNLRGMLQKRFGTDDSVPDGFFYFPTELGGLGLRNPFINAFTTYTHSSSNPSERIDRAFEQEQEEYDLLKEKWDSGEHKPRGMEYAPLAREDTGTDTEGDEPFMSFDEYTRYREEVSTHLRDAYTGLLDCPLEECVASSTDLLIELSSRALEPTPYWLWIYNLYSGDMKQRFGGQGLQLGTPGLLPVGLVDVLKSENVRWEG